MFNKKLQKFSIRKLTIGAASVLIGVSFISMNDNNTVHAADASTQTVAQTSSQDKLSEAKTNVDEAQTQLDDAQNNLANVQTVANQADNAYNAQNEKNDLAQQAVNSKKETLNQATAKVTDAQKLVDAANKPDAKENAQKDITNKETALKQAKDSEQAAETKANSAADQVADATKNVNSKQKDVNEKEATKAKADNEVKVAQDALKGTGIAQASEALANANAKVSQDQSDLKQTQQNVTKATQAKNNSDKNLANAQSAANKAKASQQAAQADYDAKKKLSDAANAPIIEKQNEAEQLQKQLVDLNDKSKNEIVISDINKYTEVYGDAWKHNDVISSEDAAWTKAENAKNHYISSEKDKNEIVDPNHLTNEQLTELSLFVSDLESKVRKQLGLNPDEVSVGSIELAKEVMQRYLDDNWSQNWHDAIGINDVSKKLGLAYNESDSADTWQYYEDMQVGGLYEKTATMDDVKEATYNALLDMILPVRMGSTAPGQAHYEMAHAQGLLGIGYNTKEGKIINEGFGETKDAGQYVSMGTTAVDGETWSFHFFNVTQYEIKDPSKFSTEIIPSYATQIANANQQLEKVNKDISNLKNNAKAKEDATAQAKQVLENAQKEVQTTQTALTKAQVENTNAKADLTKAIATQDQLQVKLSNDQDDQKIKQDAYNKLTASQEQKTNNLKVAVENQTKAVKALKAAQAALTEAQNNLAQAKQNQNTLKADVTAKKNAVQKAQAAVKDAEEYFANLNKAPELLATALNNQKVAQNNYDTANKQADTEAKKLSELKQVKDAADAKVAAAQAVVATAKENLASAQKAYNAIENEATKEEAMSGVAHIKNTITLVNGKGEVSGQTIEANSDYKVFAKKTINGKVYYRLGTDNQWVVADAVSSITPKVETNATTSETPLSTVGYLPVVKNHPTWKIALVDGDGHYTGQYLAPNTNWKVFAKKTINGQTYYRLGSEDQWIPATYFQLKNTGVVKANPVENHPTWKIALLNRNGKYTGEYVRPNTSWKVWDVQFINGRLMAKIGTDAQWIPMEFVSWLK